MKSRILLVLLVLFSHRINAQTISNPSFDSIYIGGLDRIFSWVTSDGFMIHSGIYSDTVHPLIPDTIYDATGFAFSEAIDAVNIYASPHSFNAIALRSRPDYFKTDSSHYESFIVNGTHAKTNALGYLDFSGCGEPFAHRPSKLMGKYQFIDTLSLVQNYGKCMILLKKYNSATGLSDTIAYNGYSFTNFMPTTSWQDFEIPINYWSNGIPDSIVIAFFASAEPTATATLIIDELTFDFGPAGLPNHLGDKIDLFPNPATNYVYLKNVNQQQFNYQIIGVNGAVLQNGTCVNHIFVGDLKQKFMFVELTAKDGQRKIYKVIKE